MGNTCILSTVLFFTFQHVSLLYIQCPPSSLIEPCSCNERNVTENHRTYYPVITNEIFISRRQNAIICANISNASFDIRTIFLRFHHAVMSTNHSLHFDNFILYNTQMKHLTKNIFGNVTFSNIMLYHNPLLDSSDLHAFDNTRNSVEIFEIINTSLSNVDTLFRIIRQFHNLRIIRIENDQLQSIPDYAFNNPELREIRLGRYDAPMQSLVHIGKYPFYNTPNLSVLTIFSPFLTQIGKYSFAFRVYSTSMIKINLDGLMLTGSSFESTSLTRFRGRQVTLTLYNTSIEYLDEKIFQPFLATNLLSYLFVQYSDISEVCDNRSVWIKDEYCSMDDNQIGYRILGTACCSLAIMNH